MVYTIMFDTFSQTLGRKSPEELHQHYTKIDPSRYGSCPNLVDLRGMNANLGDCQTLIGNFSIHRWLIRIGVWFLRCIEW